MTSLEFLRTELEELASNFPNVHIKYGFNTIVDTHIVELLPLVEYKTNEELDKAWIPMSLRFIERFQDEDIAFISSDSSLSLRKTLFEFNSQACSEQNLLAEIYGELTEQMLDYSFPTDVPDAEIADLTFAKFISLPVENITMDQYQDNSYLAAA
ncbi:MAG: hypothetical protein ABIO32_03580 [Ferruginibacter sp.]